MLPPKALPSKLIPRSIKTNRSTSQKGTNDEDEEIEGDFFSLTKVDSTPDVYEPVDIDKLKSTYGVASKKPTVVVPEMLPPEDSVYENMEYEDSAGMSGSNDVGLDEDAVSWIFDNHSSSRGNIIFIRDNAFAVTKIVRTQTEGTKSR